MEGSDVTRLPPSAPPGTAVPHSPWHSPVPYLFGGLAAMLGLIAFALLVLACSYWKLSGYLDAGDRREYGGDPDIEAAVSGEGELSNKQKNKAEFEEKIVVIMAGEVKPTFLATPLASATASFRDVNRFSAAAENKAEVGSGKYQPGNSHLHHQHEQD